MRRFGSAGASHFFAGMQGGIERLSTTPLRCTPLRGEDIGRMRRFSERELSLVAGHYESMTRTLEAHLQAWETDLERETALDLRRRIDELESMAQGMDPRLVEIVWDEDSDEEWDYATLVRRAAAQLDEDLSRLSNTSFLLTLASGASNLAASLFFDDKDQLRFSLFRLGMQPLR